MDTVTRRIIEFNEKRSPFFLKMKYKALTDSPFRFFRGTCHLFYEELSKNIPVNDPTKTWICGDLHLENFGTFKGNNGLVVSTITHDKTSYVIKRLQPTAYIMNLNLCKGKFKKLEEVITTFAEISASAHLRSTGRGGSSTIDDLIVFFQSAKGHLKESLLNYGKK